MGRCWHSQLTLGDGKIIWQPVLLLLFNEGMMWRIPIASVLGISSGIYSFVDKAIVFHISSKQNFRVTGLMFWGFPQWQFVDHIDEYELSNHFWQDKKLWSNFLSQKIVGWKFDNLGLVDCCKWGGVDEGLVGEGSGGWLFKRCRPTSLIWAVGHEHICVVEILLDYGANVSSFEIPQLQGFCLLCWNEILIVFNFLLLCSLPSYNNYMLSVASFWSWSVCRSDWLCANFHTQRSRCECECRRQSDITPCCSWLVMSAWWIAF